MYMCRPVLDRHLHVALCHSFPLSYGFSRSFSPLGESVDFFLFHKRAAFATVCIHICPLHSSSAVSTPSCALLSFLLALISFLLALHFPFFCMNFETALFLSLQRRVPCLAHESEWHCVICAAWCDCAPVDVVSNPVYMWMGMRDRFAALPPQYLKYFIANKNRLYLFPIHPLHSPHKISHNKMEFPGILPSVQFSVFGVPGVIFACLRHSCRQFPLSDTTR